MTGGEGSVIVKDNRSICRNLQLFIFKDGEAMDVSMYVLVEKILWGVGFIAIGGALTVMFFLVFAPSILGSRTIHNQIDKLLRQSEKMNEQLKQIIQHLKKEDSQKEP